MAKNNTPATTAPATTTRSKRGSTKQARAITLFREIAAFIKANGATLTDDLVNRATALSGEFKDSVQVPASVRLQEVKDKIAAIYAKASTDFSVLEASQKELQDLFAAKDRIEKRMERSAKDQTESSEAIPATA